MCCFMFQCDINIYYVASCVKERSRAECSWLFVTFSVVQGRAAALPPPPITK